MAPYTGLTPRPQQQSLNELESSIRQGRIKIPRFQRDFVWTKQQAATLLDSVLKGYPVGTFILWRTRDRLREVRNIGDIDLPPAPDGDVVNYVLDGQQRLTSLMASLWGATVERDGHPTNFLELWADLAADLASPWVVGEIDVARPEDFISIYDLHTRDFAFLASLPERHHARLSTLSSKLNSYQFSIIAVDDAPIDVATEIFTRINITGRRLACSRSWSPDVQRSGFDLSLEMDKLMEELSDVYDTVAHSTYCNSSLESLKRTARPRRPSTWEKSSSSRSGRSQSRRSRPPSTTFANATECGGASYCHTTRSWFPSATSSGSGNRQSRTTVERGFSRTSWRASLARLLRYR